MKDGSTEEKEAGHAERVAAAARNACQVGQTRLHLEPGMIVPMPGHDVKPFARVPPHDEEAERYVLGWSLTHPFPACVHPALFHFRAYGLIVEAVRTGGMYSERMTPDLINEAGAVLGTVWPVWDERTFNAAVDWLGHLAKQREALALMERMVEAIYAGAVVPFCTEPEIAHRVSMTLMVDARRQKLNGWRPWESVSEIHNRESGMAEGVKA